MESVTEEWRDVPGYGGRYQVSNIGRVRSVPYENYQASSHAGVMMIKHISGKMLSASDNGNGYKLVFLMKGGRKRQIRYVHRLVAEAFVENPHNYKEVNHKDFNKSNNHAYNLEWVTRKENVNWSRENMKRPRKNAKLPPTGIKYIQVRDGKFRVIIRIKRLGYMFDKCFETLEEAIEAKARFVNGKEYFTRR